MPGFAHILLCAEGPQDMGRDRPVEQEGWMQPLIRRLADDDADLHFTRWPRKAAAGVPGSRLPTGIKGHGRTAFRAMEKAVRENYDILVFMADNDMPDKRDQHRWQEICEDIWAGFKAVQNAVCGVACIPVSASEAWLLADSGAWKVLGLTDCSELPGNRAEAIWGAKGDPDGNRPHEYFARMCRNVGLNDDVPNRKWLAEHLSPATLKANCPVSFAPFARSMEACLARNNCLTGFDFSSLAVNEAPCQS